MPRIATPREGKLLTIKERQVPYSYWPMGKTTRRYGLQSHLFTPNPWALIGAAVQRNAKGTTREAASAFLEQAEEYYRAATLSGVVAAKPVLLYYCFMNLAKTYIATTDPTKNLSKPRHGLSEQLAAGGKELTDAYLDAYRPDPNLFNMFLSTLTGNSLSQRNVRFDIPALMPQVVTGHRLWCQANKAGERFIAIKSVEFMHNKENQSVWLRFQIPSGDLKRIDLTHQRLLEEGGLAAAWHEVKTPESGALCFEQTTVTNYTHRPSDVVADVAAGFRECLWATVLSMPPFRKHYIYAAPAAERPQVLPQLLSMYAVMYYLGSITRYRPQDFKKLLTGIHGAQVHTILSEQPTQFIYLMTSEFAKQEVTKAAVV